MEKQELQKVWDSNLVRYSRTTRKMGGLLAEFMQEVNPKILEDNKITEDGLAWFESLELRRCLDRKTNGKLGFTKWKFVVGDFIGAHCLPLMMAINDRRISDQDVFDNINLYKWTRHNDALRANKRRKNKRWKKKARELNPNGVKWRMNGARELDKSADWKTVK